MQKNELPQLVSLPSFRKAPHGFFTNPGYLLIAVVVAIFLSEWFVMIILDKIPSLLSHQMPLLDAGLLVSISFPVLYLLVFRPMRAHVSRRWRVELEKDELIIKLQAALAEVKTLRGIVPICASCKKIRDDTGFWNAVEVYVSRHSEALFTHSICPECMEKLYSEYKEIFSREEDRPPSEE